jgi:nicotinamide-nucleotide amidase
VIEERGRARAEELAGALQTGLDGYLFAEDEAPVEELVLTACREQGLSLATAESCTGGLVAGRLTSVPGSSDVFRGSIVAYANEVKKGALGVSAQLLERYGSVSAEAAAAMAVGARKRLEVDVAVAVTGVAGPDGGTPEKPVGLVYLHTEGPHGGRSRELNLPGDREAVRGRATVAALHLTRTFLAQSRHEAV